MKNILDFSSFNYYFWFLERGRYEGKKWSLFKRFRRIWVFFDFSFNM